MPASYVSTILAEAGLKGYWRLGELSGTGAVDAASGNNGVYINTPTLGVAGAISGDSDKAVQFARASAEYVQIPDHLAQRFAAGPCSVEFWFKLTTSDGTNSAAFAQVSGNGPYLEINGPAIGVWRWKPAGGSVGATTAGFAVTDTTTWHHLVATVDAANNYKIYLDGVDRTTVIGTPAFGYVGTSQGTIIGAADAAGAVPFNGSIDEVALYNVVLTAAQVLNHYQVGTATPAAGAIATFPGSGPNTVAAFRALVANTAYSRIEISAGTYTGWHIGGSSPETAWVPDRTAAFPLVITTAAGAAVVFDGTGVPSGDGWLYPGDWRSASPAQVGYITIDGTLNGGTITLQNYALAQQGLINPVRASHLTVDHIRVRSCTTVNGPNTFTAWCVYVHMAGTFQSDNLQFDGWDVIGPADQSLNGVQAWQDPGVAGINVRNWTALNLNRGILMWAHVTGALMEGWDGTNVTKPVSTDGIAAGITRNNTFRASGAPTILAPFIDGGGNVWNATTAVSMGAADAGVSGDASALTTGVRITQADPGLSGDSAALGAGIAILATDAAASGDSALLTSLGGLGGPAAVLRAIDAGGSSDFARIGPSATAGIPIEVTIATGGAPTVTIAVLEGARQARWYDPLNEIGNGSFVIARTDPKAGLIAKGNIATFRLQGVARYAILVEMLEVVVASVNGQSGEYVSVAGRGLEAVADKARLAPGTGIFGTVSAASVLVTAFDAAKARGTLPAGFTYDFTAAIDSAGLPWDDAAPYTLPNGTRYLDILRMLPTIGIDVAITPTMVLRAFRDGLGTDRTGQVVFRQGKHLRGEIKRAQQGAQQATRIWVEGKSGSIVQIFGDESDLAVGVREEYLKITTTDEPAILGAAGQQAIEASTQAAKAFSLPLLHGLDEGDYEPYDDYGKGDTVLVNVPGAIANERARIVAIAIAATEDGGYTVDVDGNAIVYEELVRLKRELDVLAAQVA